MRFERLVNRLDSEAKLLYMSEMNGGVSAHVTMLAIELPDGQTNKLLVRRHGRADLSRNPDVAEAEFRLLQILSASGLPTPAPYSWDKSGEIFSTPYIVMEFIDGEPNHTPASMSNYVKQLALLLTAIHNIDASSHTLSFLPKQADKYADLLKRRPASPDESLDERRIRDTLEAAWPMADGNEERLLHGDFWPGNTLWKDDELVAIIDWEDAAMGDPLADVANARLEMLWAFGWDAMEQFTRQYRSHMPAVDFTNLPSWDLCAALRPAGKMSTWGLDANTEKTMRERHNLFVKQACELIGK